ncbi:hypothetical protein [Actinokineospora bangkokensis]|uniref:Uncharacterized protein n=1 Tax=Actinokineospora bangkokensis TaxID=1193682 RepID=A0A1Q9LI55_9PSEU|nr:hypothetical protein [Actinokineospora bangkokensis]OLR91737.1 hypothetical protein BJP25_24710 [Actinokineospora bangkokensis]
MIKVLVVVLVLLVVGGVWFASSLASHAKRKQVAQSGIAGGTPVPASWAGDHSPEARMHRRLVAASRALESLPLGDVASIERKVDIEQRINGINAQLVSAAVVSGGSKAQILAALEAQVAEVEGDVARVVVDRRGLG